MNSLSPPPLANEAVFQQTSSFTYHSLPHEASRFPHRSSRILHSPALKGKILIYAQEAYLVEWVGGARILSASPPPQLIECGTIRGGGQSWGAIIGGHHRGPIIGGLQLLTPTTMGCCQFDVVNGTLYLIPSLSLSLSLPPFSPSLPNLVVHLKLELCH